MSCHTGPCLNEANKKNSEDSEEFSIAFNVVKAQR